MIDVKMRIPSFQCVPLTLMATFAFGANIVSCASPRRPPTAPPVSVQAYPVARTTPVAETHFGITTIDPYRWMEDSKPEFIKWLDEQNKFARSQLDPLPIRKILNQRLVELSGDLESVSDVAETNGILFFLRRNAGAQSHSLWMKKLPTKPGESSSERLLVDLDDHSGRHRSIDIFQPSPNGDYVVYGVADNGAEQTSLSIFDVKAGRTLPEEGPRLLYGRIGWVGNSQFMYNDYLIQNADKTNGRAIYLHRVGTDFKSDIPVFGPKLSPIPLVPDPLPEMVVTETSDLVLMRVSRGVLDPLAVFAKKKSAFESPNVPWNVLASVEDEIDDVGFRGDSVYLLSHLGAPRRKLIKVTAQSSGSFERHDIIAESKAVIQNTYVAKDAIYTVELEGGRPRIRRYDFDGHALPIPELPNDGEIKTAFAEPSADGLMIKTTSVIMPERWYRFDASNRAWEQLPLFREAKIATSAMKIMHLVAKSADGTEIPLDVVYREDTQLDGSNPTLMNVYGSYGISLQPEFKPSRLAWLEKGGVLAFAHVRGGGEFGDEWHRAGQKWNKQKSADDLIACAEKLISDGYTSPKHLGVQSQSAGGIVASMGVWQRPDLFGAAIFGSGTLQTLRTEVTPGGVANIAEFGTVAIEREFRGLLAMDAVQNVRSDVVYPPMLFSVGANDPRVAPWESGKVVARLQSIAKSRGPILLRVDFQDGHGAGSTASSEIERFSDYYSFAFEKLGPAADRKP